jgi:hypothetical protein
MTGGMVMTGAERGTGRGMAVRTTLAGGHFQRKWTKIRPKFLESFSTR